MTTADGHAARADRMSADPVGGRMCNGLSASGNTYYLRKTDGKWVVQKDVMHWIA